LKAPSEIKTVDDVLGWVKDAMELTPFGIVGITVTMHDGRPKYATPRWEPNVLLYEKVNIKEAGMQTKPLREGKK
jgi:hypothetical protein